MLRTLIIGVSLYIVGYYLYVNGYLDKLKALAMGAYNDVKEKIPGLGARPADGSNSTGFCGCGCDGKCGCSGKADSNYSNYGGCSGLNGLGYHDCGPKNSDGLGLGLGAGFTTGYGNLVNDRSSSRSRMVIEPMKRQPFFQPGTIIVQSPSIGVNSMGGFRAMNSSQAQATMPRW